MAALTAAEIARLNSFMIDIASVARGTPVADGSRQLSLWRRVRLCVFRERAISRFLGRRREHGSTHFS